MKNQTRFKSLDRIARDDRVEQVEVEDGRIWVYLHPQWFFTDGSATLVADTCREVISFWQEEIISRDEDIYLDSEGNPRGFPQDLDRSKTSDDVFDQMVDSLMGMTGSQRLRLRAVALAHQDQGTIADLDGALQRL